MLSILVLLAGTADLRAQSCTPPGGQTYTVTCDGLLSPDGLLPMMPTKILAYASVDFNLMLTANGSISLGGQLASQTASGTINVNNDCTGTLSLQRAVNGQSLQTLSFLLLVTPDQNTVNALNVNEGNVFSCTFVRVPALVNIGPVTPPTPTQITGEPAHPIVTASSQNNNASVVPKK
jgi:hypothetical protein